MNRSEQRVYSWIRQQRYMLAIYVYLYYLADEQILDDLQYDYIKKRLEVVSQRWAHVFDMVLDRRFSPPRYYADVILQRSVEQRAASLLRRWRDEGKPVIRSIKYLDDSMSEADLYRDALKTIVRYPIDHL